MGLQWFRGNGALTNRVFLQGAGLAPVVQVCHPAAQVRGDGERGPQGRGAPPGSLHRASSLYSPPLKSHVRSSHLPRPQEEGPSLRQTHLPPQPDPSEPGLRLAAVALALDFPGAEF